VVKSRRADAEHHHGDERLCIWTKPVHYRPIASVSAGDIRTGSMRRTPTFEEPLRITTGTNARRTVSAEPLTLPRRTAPRFDVELTSVGLPGQRRGESDHVETTSKIVNRDFRSRGSESGVDDRHRRTSNTKGKALLMCGLRARSRPDAQPRSKRSRSQVRRQSAAKTTRSLTHGHPRSEFRCVANRLLTNVQVVRGPWVRSDGPLSPNPPYRGGTNE
jgi:hypothetical protein